MNLTNQLLTLLTCGFLISGLPGCGKRKHEKKKPVKITQEAEEKEAREIMRQTSQKSSGGFFR